MKSHVRRAAVAAALGLGCVFPCVAAHAHAEAPADDGLKIVIVRHGEKPELGDNLSCQGENRALALPAVLLKKFKSPDFTYVPALELGKATSHARMFQTVTPLAIKQNLTLNSKFDEADVAGVAKDVRSHTGLVLMVWEHSQIPPLAKALGIDQPPPWKGKDFDSIWVITYAGGKASIAFDAESINPSAQCSF